MRGLSGVRVVDLSSGIAGAYATKLMADAGADVIKVESAAGDPLRCWSATGADLKGNDSAFFQFLHTSKRSVVGAPNDPEVERLVASANLVVESFHPRDFDAEALLASHPGLVLLSITPFGRQGPYANRPATEFTVQAESGSTASRGLPTDPPIFAGGRIGEFVGGTFASVAALAAVRRGQQTGHGEHVDFSLAEVMNIAGTTYADLFHSMSGRPAPDGPVRTVEIPSIEPTKNGWVGFNTNSRQQYQDFLLLIERTDLLGDEELARIDGRWARRDEWNEIVRSYTTQHTTEDIVEKASALRIPVAPVNNGQQVLEHIHFKERGVFVKNPGGGFRQPRPPYLLDGSGPRPLAPAPTLGEHTGQIEPRDPGRPAPRGKTAELPLKGIRVLDATAWWAGPSMTEMLGYLGAEVIHLEAIQRPDGMRMTGGMFMGTYEDWWECSPIYLGANINKKGLTLNLADPEGLALAKRLIAECDVFVENFSPRVVENFGLDWEQVHAEAPRTIMIRMPAFGLSGPWRDNVGFAQTMEQMTGLAWLTGHVHDQPRIQRGPCDPLAGMHAAFACLVGLAERDATGHGHLLECTMVEGALNAASEQIVEWSAYGNLMEREGNRSPWAAPQNIYACRGEEQWLALSVESDAQWDALIGVLGTPAWTQDPALATHVGRRAAHDLLDAELGRYLAARDLTPTIEALVEAGVPAAPVADARVASMHPQFRARKFHETFDHPSVGQHPVATVPFRYRSVDHWVRSAAPRMGEHNHDVLSGILGLSDAEIAVLEEKAVIGTRLVGL